MIGKARVAPLKQVTILRLELAAATLESRMDRMLRRELRMPLKESVLWTDSQSVLNTLTMRKADFELMWPINSPLFTTSPHQLNGGM